MIEVVRAIIVGIEALGGTDISHLTETEVLARLQGFFRLSLDEQREKVRSTIPLVRAFSPDISSPAFKKNSFLHVGIPTDLYDHIYRFVRPLGLAGQGDSEQFHIIAVAITH